MLACVEGYLCLACYCDVFTLPSNILYKTHLCRQYHCWWLRCSSSIACRRCSHYIFIIHLTLGFNNGLDKDNRKTKWETFKFGNFGAAYIRDFTGYLKFIWSLLSWVSSISSYLVKINMCWGKTTNQIHDRICSIAPSSEGIRWNIWNKNEQQVMTGQQYA